MSLYSKISRRMWGDEKFRSLSAAAPNAQTLWIYLLTGYHVTPIPGLWTVTGDEMARHLGWNRRSFRRVFDEIVSRAMLEFDENAHVLFVPRSAFYNKPHNPNQVRGWRKHWDLIPECALKAKAYFHFREQFATNSEFTAAFEQALGTPADYETRNRSGNGSRNGLGIGSTPGAGTGAGTGIGEESPITPLAQSRSLGSEPQVDRTSLADSQPKPKTDKSTEPGRPPDAAEAPAPAAANAVDADSSRLVFPCVGNEKTWTLEPAKIAEYEAAFPGSDVPAACRRAWQWCTDNPERRKTARRMGKFLFGWLERDRDKGPPTTNAAAGRNAPTVLEHFAEHVRRHLADGAVDWFPDWAARLAATLAYRHADDPIVVAAWWPLFRRRTVTQAEADAALTAYAAKPRPDRPVSRPQDRDQILALVTMIRNQQKARAPAPPEEKRPPADFSFVAAAQRQKGAKRET